MSVTITYQGRTQSINAWAKELGFVKGTLDHRIRAGWSPEKALTTPADATMAAKKRAPSKTDAMRWLEERPIAEYPPKLRKLMQGYQGRAPGLYLRDKHLQAFNAWFHEEFVPMIGPTLTQ